MDFAEPNRTVRHSGWQALKIIQSLIYEKKQYYYHGRRFPDFRKRLFLRRRIHFLFHLTVIRLPRPSSSEKLSGVCRRRVANFMVFSLCSEVVSYHCARAHVHFRLIDQAFLMFTVL